MLCSEGILYGYLFIVICWLRLTPGLFVTEKKTFRLRYGDGIRIMSPAVRQRWWSNGGRSGVAAAAACAASTTRRARELRGATWKERGVAAAAYTASTTVVEVDAEGGDLIQKIYCKLHVCCYAQIIPT